jgi:antitoxin (DNA-binding transcriptional repressor) of toxin-antitoxin stability system
MDHMKTATVRDLRYRFPEVEARLREGEEVQITKRKQVVARLVPVKPERARVYPDFLAIQKEIFGDKVVEISGKELVSWARGQH